MKKLSLLCLLLLAAPMCTAQLTPDQKLVDFQELAALFAKRYAFYEWKKQAISYDGLDLAPWVQRIRTTNNDLDFFEICMEYTARYQDGHTAFELPSTFYASLGFSADIYDGKLLVDNIDRQVLKEDVFPAQIGDELIAIDGRPAEELMADYRRFIGEGNPRVVARVAAALLTIRVQSYIARAQEIGDKASVVVLRQNGATETYSLPWKKTGTPYAVVGPVPDPSWASMGAARRDSPGSEEEVPPYMKRLRALQTYQARRGRFDLGVGRLRPVFTLPESFVQRLGSDKYDSFYSGSFQTGGRKIGYLRVPSFEYFFRGDLETEIRFFEANTDGLIVDVMANPGGSGCATESFMQCLMPKGFHSVAQRLRVTWDFVLGFQQDLEMAKAFGDTTDEEIAQLTQMLQAVQTAYLQNRGFTVPLPICGTSQDLDPRRTKPVTWLPTASPSSSWSTNSRLRPPSCLPP